jgi:tryptophan synthase alpha chain
LENRSAFIPFVMGGDPDFASSKRLIGLLADAGADLIEIGVAFTDPMADGPAIQAAGLRAMRAGQTLTKTLELVRRVREENHYTPIILMGYYNPIYVYGVDRFVAHAVEAGVDGVIIVDLPPEEDAEFRIPAQNGGLDFIRLATPTTDATRLKKVVNNSSGFIYYVSVAGVTGAGGGQAGDISSAVHLVKAASGLPVAVGFGIKTVDQARAVAKIADAVVVGSALVERLATGMEGDVGAHENAIDGVAEYARELAAAVHGARGEGK